MKRIISALAVLLALALPLQAFAEDPVPLATSTDLCAHENTETVYYFDTPVYTPMNAYTHSVTGKATVEVHCKDCDTTISITTEDNAEAVYPHTFRRGACVLCGMEGEAEVQEIVLVLEPDEENGNFYAASFTPKEMENAGDILVLRAGENEPAVVLQTKRLRATMDEADTLTAEMALSGERKADISVVVTNENGEETVPEGTLLALRFYGTKDETVRTVTYTDAEGNTRDQDVSWVNGGHGGYYMAFPYLGNGTYEY